MTVERVTAQLNVQFGDRFLVLYGANTNDTFCTPDLQLQNIEQVVHQYLQDFGYQRILFYTGINKLYFLDRQSRDNCLPRSTSAPPKDPNRLRVTPGPLGHKRGLLPRKATEQAPHTPTDPQIPPPPKLQDVSILPHFEAAMRHEKEKCAIVFSQAQDIRQFDNVRELFGRMEDWLRLPPTNTNICILIFHHETLFDQGRNRGLQSFCDDMGFSLLSNIIANRDPSNSQSFNICYIGSPGIEEIRALCHYFRLQQGKKVDWRTLNSLCSFLAAENKSLNHWYDQFNSTSEISLTEARRRRWLSGNVSDRPALERLDQMIGLQAVKETIRRRKSTLEVQLQRIQQGQSVDPPRLHLVFKGNPGTGKTTVARLIGEIYRDLGILQRGHIVEVAGRDLVAGYVGQTHIRTTDIINRALDGVLFIDEAYTLSQGGDNDFGQEAIDTLLKRMEDDRNRLAVIVAGYTEQIDGFIHSNPGLESRFRTEIVFPDYTPEELFSIFRQQLQRVQCEMSPELEKALPTLLVRLPQSRGKNFANAREIENLFTEMDELRSQRIGEQRLNFLKEPFQLADLSPKYRQFIDSGNQESLDDLLQELESMIGLHSVKMAIREVVQNQVANKLLRENNPAVSEEIETRHMLFTGNPGTGKTTLARLVGRIFKALGLLKQGQFVEVDRRSLVAGYVGQTAEKTARVVESAIDGVLFIDEAYALSRGESSNDFGQEAIDTLVSMMENNRDRLVVIFAGYSTEMKQFVNANSGIASRIAYNIEFPDYTGEEMHQIFLYMCKKAGRICPPEVSARMQEIFLSEYNFRGDHFGNARDVRNIYEKLVKAQKNRIASASLAGKKPMSLEELMTFSLEDTTVLEQKKLVVEFL